MSSPFVIASSALSFVPTVIAIWTQPLFVFLIFGFASIMSLLYHISGQAEYETYDLIWANITVLVGLVLLGLIMYQYPLRNWHVWFPILMVIVALIMFFYSGDFETDPDRYNLFHSLWHIFMTVAAISIVITPINYSALYIRARDLVRKQMRKYKTKK